MIPEPILSYIEEIESEDVCRYQKALAKHLRNCFENEVLIFDDDKYSNYLRLEKYLPFKLLSWEKFITALWDCTFTIDLLPRWDTVFCKVGRGSGKDGYLSFNAFACVSPFNPVQRYDVDICANNEEQAIRPCEDIADILENPKYESKLLKHYYHTKEVIRGRKNKGKIKGRTNNPNGRDGMRSGKIIFNEVHQYQNYDNINVFTTGLGKVAEARTGIFTSDGFISDGPLDDYTARSDRILFENEPDRGFLPFICRLDDESEVHDFSKWGKANPSIKFFPNLRAEIEREYYDWKEHPEQNADFLPKRFGIRKGFKEISVTDYEKIIATNKPLPDLSRMTCTVGIDYAELSDWAAVNLHFRKGDERFDINHAWICRDSKTLSAVKAPWKEWVSNGICTFVDDVSINPDLIAEYISIQGRKYNVMKIALDNFRYALLSTSLKKIGFDANNKNRVHLLKPSDIMKTDPIIQNCFDRNLFTWGNNPCLRWAVNNTKRIRSSRNIGSDTGNFYYAKIEAKSRKTDPFMALVASMAIEDCLGTGVVSMPSIGAINLS